MPMTNDFCCNDPWKNSRCFWLMLRSTHTTKPAQGQSNQTSTCVLAPSSPDKTKLDLDRGLPGPDVWPIDIGWRDKWNVIADLIWQAGNIIASHGTWLLCSLSDYTCGQDCPTMQIKSFVQEHMNSCPSQGAHWVMEKGLHFQRASLRGKWFHTTNTSQMFRLPSAKQRWVE